MSRIKLRGLVVAEGHEPTGFCDTERLAPFRYYPEVNSGQFLSIRSPAGGEVAAPAETKKTIFDLESLRQTSSVDPLQHWNAEHTTTPLQPDAFLLSVRNISLGGQRTSVNPSIMKPNEFLFFHRIKNSPVPRK